MLVKFNDGGGDGETILKAARAQPDGDKTHAFVYSHTVCTDPDLCEELETKFGIEAAYERATEGTLISNLLDIARPDWKLQVGRHRTPERH